MRLPVAVASLAIAATIASTQMGWLKVGDAEPCEEMLSYRGTSYVMVPLAENIQGAEELGAGSLRGCGEDGVWTNEINVSRIANVDPAIAVVASGYNDYTIYIRVGTLTDELPPKLADAIQ